MTRESACSGDCHKCAGCGAVRQTVTVQAENDIHARPGDVVYIESGSAVVLRAAALTYVATTVIKIPAPTGGYVHIGDGLVLLCGWILGPWWGGAAAGIGSMLVDLLGGYMSFVPGTLIIKFLDAMAAALIVKALGRKTYSYVVGGLAGEAIMVAGYFVYEALALQLGMGAAAGVLANVGQGAVGLVIALVLMALLKGSKALDKLAVQW